MQSESENRRFVQAAFTLVLAAALWLLVFLPHPFLPVNFWILLSTSCLILFTVSVLLTRIKVDLPVRPWPILTGGIIGILLYGLFYAGFQFTKSTSIIGPGVGQVYNFGSGTPILFIVTAIVFPIAPGEEVYWRGLIQRRFGERLGEWPGYLLASAAYSLVHLPTMNVPLLLTALIGGLVWGYLYKRTHSLLPCIASHVVFDLLIFAIAPLA